MYYFGTMKQHSTTQKKQQRKRISNLLLLVLLSLITNPLFAMTPHWQSPQYIHNSFLDIALNNEYSTKISQIRKWTQPIYYSISHRTADEALHQQITELHLKHLESITGVEIQPSTSKSQTNLTIIFSSEALLAKELEQDFLITDKAHINELSHHGVCVANISLNPDNSIRKAAIIIPVDRARAHAKLLSCVVEELTQIMGLPNDSDSVFPSIFNDRSHNDYLSGLDFILLKLLYHPQIKAGMNKKQTLQNLQSLTVTDDFQQLIKQSEYLVNQQGLYRLLN